MKHLILVRHAKSSRDDAALSDFDRSLSSKGEKDAPFMAKLFRKMKIESDLVISSPAKRARVTAKIFADELKYPADKINLIEEIYLGNTNQLLKIIRMTNDKITNLMLFGHNPGITSLCNLLSDKFITNIPTSGIVILTSEVKSWNDLTHDTCKIEGFEYPKKYK